MPCSARPSTCFPTHGRTAISRAGWKAAWNQSAAGQNMVGRATFAACNWILDHYAGVANFYLESNFATDKKGSQVNMMRTRGKRVTAEATATREELRRSLYCELTPDGGLYGSLTIPSLIVASARRRHGTGDAARVPGGFGLLRQGEGKQAGGSCGGGSTSRGDLARGDDRVVGKGGGAR